MSANAKSSTTSKLFIAIACFLVLTAGCTTRQNSWGNINSWKIETQDQGCALKLSTVQDGRDKAIQADYKLRDEESWVKMELPIGQLPSPETPISFDIKANAGSNIEIKFIDSDGSIFWAKYSLAGKYENWTKTAVSLRNLEYAWGGKDDNFDKLSLLEFCFSGTGSGKVWIKNIRFADKNTVTTLPIKPKPGSTIDPNAKMVGVGFAQRRAEKMLPEDPLVLEYLKIIQDTSSPEKQLLPSMEDLEAQTFNNSLVAMAFILKGERERAERILDFYANATDKNNQDQMLQNLYYNGEGRGFFQYVAMRDSNVVSPDLHTEGLAAPGETIKVIAYHNPGRSDRWMGDMVWLMYTYKHYEKTYKSDRYADIIKKIMELLVSWYTDDPEGGGYIQHGWRKGDKKLHEGHGHPEGNVDCYALFKILGNDEMAGKIKTWLDRQFGNNKNLPLDLYTWRTLAYGKDYAYLLDIPDYDLRYRKTLTINGKKVMGFYHGPDINANNIWLDGTGHIACAYLAYGDKQRGYFYSNQLDGLLIDRIIDGKKTRALPYTANKTSGYDWVNPNKGFISVCAWYIFAKNRFNPMTLEKFDN
ncbi:hypothetical protein KAS42_01390 [bacterium]|nr:hypothetical protein [bacterium]